MINRVGCSESTIAIVLRFCMKYYTRTHSSAGFSLVELSIVLVILGLLVGGILAGQSLIRAAELRSVTTENSRYLTAVNAFKDKYFAIPGDFRLATSFGWTGAANGNQNGFIEATVTNYTTVTGAPNEISEFWTHLSAAGLIEGNFTAVATDALVLGTNRPRSKLNSAGWNVGWLPRIPSLAVPSGAAYYDGSYGNVYFFGADAGTNVYNAPAPVMKAEEAWNIDTKMDDGLPGQGSVLSLLTHEGTAVTEGCSQSATAYTLDNPDLNACSLIFKMGY